MKDLGTVELVANIALRCFRPRASGWKAIETTGAEYTPVAPLVRGADGAARHPYLVRLCAFWLVSAICLSSFAHAQPPAAKVATSGPGKDFKFPDYYPSSNGVRQLKTLVTGSEARFVSNNMNMVHLQQPRLTNYTADGKLEWSASSPECTVNVATREVRGSSNLFFQTADEKLFVRGVGFLWQSNSSVLILSNQVFTRIDKSSLTNNASQKP